MRKINYTVKTNCLICHKKLVLDYKEISLLDKYITDRGKIMPRSRTGVCQKHQRRLTKAVKQARHLALLPFVARA